MIRRVSQWFDRNPLPAIVLGLLASFVILYLKRAEEAIAKATGSKA